MNKDILKELDRIVEGTFPEKQMELFYELFVDWFMEEFDRDREYAQAVKSEFWQALREHYPESYKKLYYFADYSLDDDIALQEAQY